MNDNAYFDELNALYLEVLERSIDPSGYETYSKLREAGTTLSGIAKILRDSSEYAFLPHHKKLVACENSQDDTVFLKTLEVIKQACPDNLRVAFAEINFYEKKSNFKRSAEIHETLRVRYPENADIKLSHVNCLIFTGERKKARDLLVQYSTDSEVSSKPIFLKLCARALDKLDLNIWRRVAENSTRTEVDLIFLTRYISLLESMGLDLLAINFACSIIDKQNYFNTRSYVTALFEKMRLENKSYLQNLQQPECVDQKFRTYHRETLQQVELQTRGSSFGTLFQRNLKTFQTLERHYHRCYFSTRTNPLEAFKLVKHIITNLHNRKSFTLIRLGDCEGSYLGYNDPTYERLDQARAQRLWWGDTHLDDHEGKPEVISTFHNTVENADIIGITDHQTFIEAFTPDQLDIEVEGHSIRGYLAINEYFTTRKSKEIFAKKILTSSFVNHHLNDWGLYDLIFYFVNRCAVISCHQSILKFLERRFSVSVDKLYVIPSEHQYIQMMDMTTAKLHYPDTYIELCNSIKVDYPGELFLVGAGFLGKIYCNIVKNKGGIALDIGSLFDYWLSFETRGIFSTHDDVNRLSVFFKYLEFSGDMDELNEALSVSGDIPENTKYFLIRQDDVTVKGAPITTTAIPSVLQSERQEGLVNHEEYKHLCSHLNVLQMGVDMKLPYFVVQERELELDYNFQLDTQKIVETAPDDWEILQLCNDDPGMVDELGKTFLQGEYWVPYHPNYSRIGMYVIKKCAAEKLLNLFFKQGNVDVSHSQALPLTELLFFYNAVTYTSTFPVLLKERCDFETNKDPCKHSEINNTTKKLHILASSAYISNEK